MTSNSPHCWSKKRGRARNKALERHDLLPGLSEWLLEAEDVGDQIVISELSIIKLGISLWLERRNTFKERAVVEVMLAMSTKLAGLSRPSPPMT